MSFQKYDKVNKIRELIAGGTLWADTPVGTISAFGGSTAPDGWLLCQGQALSRTEYASLFSVIGTSFGSGDGSTTFNIPDLRGKFAEGLPASGRTLGESVSAGLPNISGSVGGDCAECRCARSTRCKRGGKTIRQKADRSADPRRLWLE